MASSIGRRAPIIALCGTSTSTPAEDALAQTVGQLCAQRGALVLCGGLGGVMSSGARGVADAGGTVIGFLPGSDADEGNEFLTYSIPTGLGEMRNGLLAKAAAGMIAIGGGWGTLSEIGFMMRLGKPVANLSSWGIQQPGESHNDPSMHWTTDPQDAVEWLFKAIEA
jgi:uncharacterized protein (TIGR00725 family)